MQNMVTVVGGVS